MSPRACTRGDIRPWDLPQYEEGAIYAVNLRIPNIGRIEEVRSTEQSVGIIKSGRGHVDLCKHKGRHNTLRFTLSCTLAEFDETVSRSVLLPPTPHQWPPVSVSSCPW